MHKTVLGGASAVALTVMSPPLAGALGLASLALRLSKRVKDKRVTEILDKLDESKLPPVVVSMKARLTFSERRDPGGFLYAHGGTVPTFSSYFDVKSSQVCAHGLLRIDGPLSCGIAPLLGLEHLPLAFLAGGPQTSAAVAASKHRTMFSMFIMRAPQPARPSCRTPWPLSAWLRWPSPSSSRACGGRYGTGSGSSPFSCGIGERRRRRGGSSSPLLSVCVVPTAVSLCRPVAWPQKATRTRQRSYGRTSTHGVPRRAPIPGLPHCCGPLATDEIPSVAGTLRHARRLARVLPQAGAAGGLQGRPAPSRVHRLPVPASRCDARRARSQVRPIPRCPASPLPSPISHPPYETAGSSDESSGRSGAGSATSSRGSRRRRSPRQLSPRSTGGSWPRLDPWSPSRCSTRGCGG